MTTELIIEDISTIVPVNSMDVFSLVTVEADAFTNSSSDTIVNTTVTSFTADTSATIPSSKYVQFAVTLFFVIVGLFGNICTIIIMTKQRLSYNAHGVYLTALAIADIKSLLVVTLNKPLLIDIFGLDVRAFTDIGCKMFKYIGRVAVISSSYFVVMICIERFIAIWFPLKAKFLLSKKKAVYSVCAVFATIYLVNIPCIVYTGIKDGICLPDFALEPIHFLPRFNSMLTWALHTMIPTLIMIILTPLIILQLYRQRLIRRELAMGNRKRDDFTNRITAMLISIVITYFFLVCIFSVAFWVLNLLGISVLTSSSHWARVFRDVYETAELVSYSFNFFLYVVTSTDFRRQIVQLFRSSSNRSHNFNSVSALQNTTETAESSKRTYFKNYCSQ